MSLLLPAKKRDSADLTNRSANQRPRIFWEYLQQHKLVEKAMQSPFASLFYMVENNAIPYLLVHHLLLREVDTSMPDELHVLLGSTICHFGRREFGLLTGLKLVGDDIPADFEKQMGMGSGSFVDRVFQGRPNTIICKSYFLALFLRSASERYKKDHTWSLSLIRAIKGVGGLCKTPWTATSEILTIWNVQRMHWVTVYISIPEWCISVYDSSFHVLDEDETMKNLKEMCVALPLVMHVSGSFDEAPVMKQDPIPPFKLNRVKDVNIVPQSETSGDCGIYALKYVEHSIALDNNFKDIIDKNMPYFRLRLAMDIFHQNKLP